MSHDVFISFKNSGRDGNPTPDAREARRLYEALKGAGLKVFFSEESLAEAGKGHFSKTIEAALESARILVLVASCREHVESQWVEAEWDSFLQDVRSGNKQGELFILNCGGLRPLDLPLFLRRQQMFPSSEIDRLVKFVCSALPVRATLDDFVKVSLHCLRPDQNEDKIYIMTVHDGTVHGRYHVTAYWGARTAKRLSSQMKAINSTPDEAATEVERARKEKLRSGYRPRPVARLITAAARAQLVASLGIVDAQAPRTPADSSKSTSTGPGNRKNLSHVARPSAPGVATSTAPEKANGKRAGASRIYAK